MRKPWNKSFEIVRSTMRKFKTYQDWNLIRDKGKGKRKGDWIGNWIMFFSLKFGDSFLFS